MEFVCEKIFVIGDLHLSIGVENKEMDVFVGYDNYMEKLKTNWNKVVSDNDIVIVCGDICWAKRLEKAVETLNYIAEELNGRKVLIRGNHDYWFDSVKKLNEVHKNLFFTRTENVYINNYSFVLHKGYYSNKLTDEDEKLYKKEYNRIKTSIEQAQSKKDNRQIIVALHYPPILTSDIKDMNNTLCDNENEKSVKYDIIREILKSDIKQCFYGHIHKEHKESKKPPFYIADTKFTCVSADFLDFTPIEISI